MTMSKEAKNALANHESGRQGSTVVGIDLRTEDELKDLGLIGAGGALTRKGATARDKARGTGK